MYMNPMKSLPWGKHTQEDDYPCLFCLTFLLLYQKETTGKKTDEKIRLFTRYL